MSRTLRTLVICNAGSHLERNALSSAPARIDILLPALRMNQSIEHLLLSDLDDRIFNFLPAELLGVILNHSTIKHLEWQSAQCEWPMLATPEKPKAMDVVLLIMCPESMIGIAYLLQRLASLKRLGLEIDRYGSFNWEFLSIVSRLGTEEFSLRLYGPNQPGYSISNLAIPIGNCFWQGLRRLTLDVFEDQFELIGMAAALGGATTLTSLVLDNFDCIGFGDELIDGLLENRCLERIKLRMRIQEEAASLMQIDVITAEMIEAIFNHPNIRHAKLDFGRYECDRPVYLPPGYAELLKRLKPTLEFVLSSTTEIPPNEATQEEIEAVSDTYERIVEAATSGRLHS